MILRNPREVHSPQFSYIAIDYKPSCTDMAGWQATLKNLKNLKFEKQQKVVLKNLKKSKLWV